MKEFFYQLFQLFTDAVMHIPLAFLRNVYGRMVLKSMGAGSQLARHVHLISPHKITIGKNSFINRNVTLDGRRGIVIGDNTDIGEFVSVWSLQHNYNDSNHATVGGATIIEDHCWIAPHSIILPSRVIKRGTVVATGAIVTKDFPENSVVGGIPARFIAHRDNDLQYELKYRLFF